MSGTASIRWVRPIFTIPENASAFADKRVAQRPDRREQPVDQLLGGRDVHSGREGVVGGLRHVDVVVRVDR